MPITDDQLTSAYDKATREGPQNLTGADREHFLIQDFILEWEMGSLSGYLYNRVPDFRTIRETTESMNHNGLPELASILDRAIGLFEGYQDPDPPTTWAAILTHYDPESTLEELDQEIDQLDNYGLAQ